MENGLNRDVEEKVLSPRKGGRMLAVTILALVAAIALLAVSMSGLLAYCSFCLSWWASSGLAGLPLCFSKRKIACCAMNLLSPFLSHPGFSTGKIPPEIARIGLEWIESKSIF